MGGYDYRINKSYMCPLCAGDIGNGNLLIYQKYDGLTGYKCSDCATVFYVERDGKGGSECYEK